jgi:hypothetical protein
MIRAIVLASMCVGALGDERKVVASTGNAMASTKNATASTAQQTTPSPADQAAVLACTKACPKLLDIKVEDCEMVKEGSLCMQGEPACSWWKLMDSYVQDALKKCDVDGSTTAAARPSAVATSSATKVISVLAQQTTPSPADQAAMLACSKACPKLLDIKVEDCETVKEGSLCMQGKPQCSSWKLMDSHVAEALKKCDADGSTTAAAARPSAVATSSATKVTSVLALTTALATLFA